MTAGFPDCTVQGYRGVLLCARAPVRRQEHGRLAVGTSVVPGLGNEPGNLQEWNGTHVSTGVTAAEREPPSTRSLCEAAETRSRLFVRFVNHPGRIPVVIMRQRCLGVPPEHKW